MGSLVRRKFHTFLNSVLQHQKTIVAKRMQQTNAVLNSTTEIHQFSKEVTPVFKYAALYEDKTAIRDLHGDYSYTGLFLSSKQFANDLNALIGEGKQERIAFLMPNDASYVIAQWACWMSGQIAVPLSDQHPASVLEYYIKDSDAKIIVTTQEFLPIIESAVANTKRQIIVFDSALRALAMKSDGKTSSNRAFVNKKGLGISLEAGVPGDFYNNSNAMFVYTSGTTSKPKGVVISHKNIQSQVNALISAWKHTDKDILLHTLPLNHIHGIINVLLCPLFVGGRCVMLPKFMASSVWSQLLAVNLQNTERVNVFAAVPTIYMKLIHEFDQLFSKNKKIKDYVYNVCSTKIRLMISGSAPLPEPIFERWEEITGHRLLERYGMTETGMVLSNPLEGERIPGTVGKPLPGVNVRIVNSNSSDGDYKPTDVLLYGDSKSSKLLNNAKDPLSGELHVKGDSVFKMYWQKPDATKKSFTEDGWFKTGDTVQYKDGIYKMLGRSSVDIIKTGGYKVSALEIETVLLGHPDIVDCAVVGIKELTWGQKVAAVVVLAEGKEIILSQLREFAKSSLPSYAVPTVLKVVNKIPKNSMGKVSKPEIISILFPEDKVG